MPIHTIDSINYITTGDRQKILNFDIVRPNGEIEKNVSFFTDNEAETYQNSISNDFTYDAVKNRNEFGFVFDKMSSTVIRDLYDFKDIALQSAIAERITAYRTKEETNDDNANIEIYFPHFIENPIGFIQIAGYSYGITNKTVVNPLIRQTDLIDTRTQAAKTDKSDSMQTTWHFFLNPYDKLGSTTYDPGMVENIIPTYLYTPLENLKPIVSSYLTDVVYANMLSDDELSTDVLTKIESGVYSATSSYYAFVQFYKSHGADVLSNLFKPVYNYKNIPHNYIMEIPLDNKNIPSPDHDNSYSTGIINADIIMAKNLYDDIYDTNTVNNGIFNRIRDYKSTGSVGQKMFLTYFDDQRYSPIDEFFKAVENYESISGSVKDINEKNVPVLGLKRDYQKVECVDAINRFISTTSHKANLYSTRVYGLDKVLPRDKYSDEYKDNIKHDIRTSICRIVSKFAPAHTQYFDVVEFSRENIPTEEYC